MARVGTSDWRVLDVDALEEDVYVPESLCTEGWEDKVEQKDRAIRSAVSNGSYLEAVKEAIKDPLYTPDEAARNKIGEAVAQALAKFKDDAIKKAVTKDFSPDELDLLIKYVYRGLAKADAELSPVLLKWHVAIVEQAGIGCVVRAFADRRTV